MTLVRSNPMTRAAVLGLVLTAMALAAAPAAARVTAFKQAVAEAAAGDRAVAAFYRGRDFTGIWTDDAEDDRARLRALMSAMKQAGVHGLPASRYDTRALISRMEAARTARDLGFLEVALSKRFLRLARDMQTGVLIPSRVISGIKRQVPYRDRTDLLTRLAKAEPRAFFRELPPQTNEYSRLVKEKLRLQRKMEAGGWGPEVPARALEPGQSGRAVVALRNRLMAMGFLARSVTQTYDTGILQAVQRFQRAHGLEADGVAGPDTVAEINKPIEARLQAVLVAMERERWLNFDRGDRHVLVNLTDFSARLVDNDVVTFRTRAVVGKNTHDRRSPEFSDEMEHLIINPTWHVPRSIAVKEYLPKMKRNPYAAGHLKLVDSRGRAVSRSRVNFSRYNRRNFPFDLKQPPSPRNALGLVKFMFPNKYNIYLHDTPQKHLFDRNKRDFSHGCIRLQKPFEFAYELLARQEDNPKQVFHSILDTGRETRVDLDKHVPVHIIYRTAFTRAKGPTHYRADVYGRDGRIWNALSNAGVSLHAVQG